jgi:hypothetical protein
MLNVYATHHPNSDGSPRPLAAYTRPLLRNPNARVHHSIAPCSDLVAFQITTALKAIEPHRRFSYDGAMNLKDNSRNLPPIGQPKIRPINPRLEDLERKISRNFFEAAEALREIRDVQRVLREASW